MTQGRRRPLAQGRGALDDELLRIALCTPSTYDGPKATRCFRDCTIQISVQDPDGVCLGVKVVTLNGQALNGNLVLGRGD